MGDYTIIADMGDAIVSLLREHMVPDVIRNPESIGIYNPEEKGNLMLGVYLYDIQESEEYRNSGMVSLDTTRQKYPSTYLSLYYMITAYSSGDVKLKAIEEQKILGKALQVLSDYPMLDSFSLQPVEKPTGRYLRIEFISIPLQDKLRMWTVPNKSYRLSLYVKVGPVELESAKTRDITRIVSLDLAVKEK